MKVVLQDGIKDCGVCSLLSIIRHYGGNASKEYLRDLTNTTKCGVTAFKLIEASKKLGFEANALNGNIEEIDANNLPCIAHVILNKSYQHFIVIYDIDFLNEKMLIMDPAKGKKIISINEFKLQTSNNYIFLKPTKKLPIFSEKKIIKDTITNFVKKEKKYIVFLTLLTIFYFLLNVLSAFHFKYLLEYVINYNVDKNLYLISYIVLILYILKELSAYLRDIILLKYSEIFDEVITTKTYKQIVLLPYLYYKNRTTGEVISRIKDLGVIKNFLAKLITSITTDILCIIIFIVILFNINKTMTLVSICLLISLITINFLLKNNTKKKTNKYYRQEEKINSYLIETLSSVDAIKGMHIEKKTIDKFMIKYKNYLSSLYSLTLITETNQIIKNIIHDLFTVIILYLGTSFIIKGKITLSEMIIYQSILSFYLSSFKSIIDLINDYPKYKTSIERIEDLFTIKEEVFEGSNYYIGYNLGGDIRYNNLNYSYNSKTLLKNINLEIKEKDKIFLYGPSGTGKSTLVKLLMRYVEIPFGNITINNIDINHYHLDTLRKNITYVSQQEFLFNDTIYNNISLNNEEEAEVKKVMKLTFSNEVGKIDSIVEENGFNFSGGERQRIILARSILKKSDIYIFDEALSQIDVKKERQILLNIFNYLKDKTIIVISHRFDNKDLFQRIIKLENSIINEEKLWKQSVNNKSFFYIFNNKYCVYDKFINKKLSYF